MRVRSGEFAYEELMNMVEERVARIAAAYTVSSLREAPDVDALESALVAIREEFYLG